MAKTKKSFVDLKHEDYEKLAARWLFLLKSYVGGDEYINHSWDLWTDIQNVLRDKDESFLHKFGRENDKDFIARIGRSYYLNFCRTVIHIYKSHIARKGIDRTENKDADYMAFASNVNGAGATLDQFLLEQVLPKTQVYGSQVVLIDMKSAPGDIDTKADEKAAGMEPFARLIEPFNLLDWQATNEKFDWVKIRDFEIEKIDDPTKQTEKKVIEIFTIWTKTGWQKFDGSEKMLAEGAHPLGEVPAVVAFNERSFYYDWPLGLSAINDIADNNKEIYNMTSLMQEFLYKQCFPQLALDEDSIGKIIELGNSNAIPLTKDMFVPTYISPPIEPAKFIQDVIHSLIQEIYRQAIVRDASVVMGQAESGISKAFDFHDSQQNIARKSKNMEAFETEFVRVAMKWKGKEDFKHIVKWPVEFDIKTINEEIMETKELFESDMGSKTLNQEIMKSKVPRLVQDDNLIEKINAEIDKTDPALSIQDRMALVKINGISILDLISYHNPDATDDELPGILEKNIKENKAFIQALTAPKDGIDNQSKIAERLKNKGIKVGE